MFDRNAFANSRHALLFERAEERFDLLLTENGASQPTQLPMAVAGKLFRRAVAETAAAEFKGADLHALNRGIRSFTHPAFFPALERVRDSIAAIAEDSDLSRHAIGVDAAVVLAGFGLAVAPYNRKVTRLLEYPSNHINTVLSVFRRRRAAVVGYSTCEAPFYVLLTNCLRAFLRRLPTSPELSEIRMLHERTGKPLPSDPGKCFERRMALLAREHGDRIPTIKLMDPSAFPEDIVLLAGWEVDGVCHGATEDGYHPVPLHLLDTLVFDPKAVSFLSNLVGPPPTIH